MAGKGDNPRKVNLETYGKNYDSIFRKSKDKMYIKCDICHRFLFPDWRHSDYKLWLDNLNWLKENLYFKDESIKKITCTGCNKTYKRNEN